MRQARVEVRGLGFQVHIIYPWTAQDGGESMRQGSWLVGDTWAFGLGPLGCEIPLGIHVSMLGGS